MPVKGPKGMSFMDYLTADVFLVSQVTFDILVDTILGRRKAPSPPKKKVAELHCPQYFLFTSGTTPSCQV